MGTFFFSRILFNRRTIAPVPVHLQPAYAGRLKTGPSGLAVSERAAREVLSLPMYPQLDDEAVGAVIAAFRAVRGG